MFSGLIATVVLDESGDNCECGEKNDFSKFVFCKYSRNFSRFSLLSEAISTELREAMFEPFS